MSVYIQSDNKLVTCPYDEAHKVKASRLQMHIAKCKLNHLDLEKQACPFNATHLLERGEFDHHLINCPDRGALDRQLAQTVDKNNPYKGQNSTPMFSQAHVDIDEDWDLGVCRQAPSIAFVQPPPGAVIEPRDMSKPAERRKLYKDMHQLQPEAENISSPATKSVPRQPKEQSETQKLQNVQQTYVQAIQSLGLGRGRPSRIAANIFDKGSNGQTENTSYSNIVKDMSNLGLGRGLSACQATVPVYNDDDFPALGCGRGSLQAPKQSLRTPGSKPEK